MPYSIVPFDTLLICCSFHIRVHGFWPWPTILWDTSPAIFLWLHFHFVQRHTDDAIGGFVYKLGCYMYPSIFIYLPSFCGLMIFVGFGGVSKWQLHNLVYSIGINFSFFPSIMTSRFRALIHFSRRGCISWKFQKITFGTFWSLMGASIRTAKILFPQGHSKTQSHTWKKPW